MSEILPGLSMDDQGQVTVNKAMGDLLIDLAIELEDAVSAPVDVQHVLAAMILAARAGQIDASTSLTSANVELMATLRDQLRVVFDHCGGNLDGDST